MNDQPQVDLLFVVFVISSQADTLTERLREMGFRFTQVDSKGGFLQEKTDCLFIGTARSRFEELLGLIRLVCKKQLQYIPARMDMSVALHGQPVMIEAEIGGANIIVLEVEKFLQLG